LGLLDSWEKIEYADPDDFVTSASVKLSKGEKVGYVVRLTNDTALPTGTFTTLFKMVAVPIAVPSWRVTTATETIGKIGDFYDVLVPLTSGNLTGTRYVYAEYTAPGTAGPQTVTLTQSGQTVTLNVTVINNTLTANSKPFYVLMVNSFLTYGHYGAYQGGSEALGIPYSQMLYDHGVFPYGNQVANPTINGGRLDYDTPNPELDYDFRTNVLAFAPGENRFTLPNYTTQASLEAAQTAITADSQTGTWFYTWDEPAIPGDVSSVNSRIATQGTYAPGVKTMVTTYADSGVTGNDVYCPVIDYFETGLGTDTVESDYSGSELWLYTSCQENSCGTNRNGDPDAVKVSGGWDGAPGMIMDHSAAHVYAFLMMPIKYTTVQALLYYNSVENHVLYSSGNGVDVWKDPFNFSGNGDGELIYPRRDGMFGLSGEVPAASTRLKIIRSARYLMDYAEMAGAGAISSCGGGSLITTPINWELDADVWRTFRSCLITALGF